MEKRKCPQCSLVNWSTSTVCTRCGFNFSGSQFSNNFNHFASEAKADNSIGILIDEKLSPQEVRKNAWKKILWGAILSSIGIAITYAVFANSVEIQRVGFFAIITLTPAAAALAGIVEFITGISIFEITDNWEKLPEGQGWLIGFIVFGCCVLTLFLIIGIVIFAFF